MKKFIIIAGLLLSQNIYAQNVIYKCTSKTGEITYQNNSGDKSICSKTDLAAFSGISIYKSDVPKNKNPNISMAMLSNMSPINVNPEQRERDNKRAIILTKELQQEKEQFEVVSKMLKNLKDTDSKDTSQIAKLEELKNSHSNNVVAIERELKASKSALRDPTTTALKNGLPFALPEPLDISSTLPKEFVKFTSVSVTENKKQ